MSMTGELGHLISHGPGWFLHQLKLGNAPLGSTLGNSLDAKTGVAGTKKEREPLRHKEKKRRYTCSCVCFSLRRLAGWTMQRGWLLRTGISKPQTSSSSHTIPWPPSHLLFEWRQDRDAGSSLPCRLLRGKHGTNSVTPAATHSCVVIASALAALAVLVTSIIITRVE